MTNKDYTAFAMMLMGVLMALWDGGQGTGKSLVAVMLLLGGCAVLGALTSDKEEGENL